MSLQLDTPPGIEHRRARQREEARRTILDATELLLIESGGFDFSIRSLSKRCGYSAPTVYHYFGDKDGLIDALKKSGKWEKTVMFITGDHGEQTAGGHPANNPEAWTTPLVMVGPGISLLEEWLSPEQKPAYPAAGRMHWCGIGRKP